MTYDFFADSSDKIEILNFIFNETDLQIFDLASAYEQEIARYRIIDDITSKFDLRKGGSPKIISNYGVQDLKPLRILEK